MKRLSLLCACVGFAGMASAGCILPVSTGAPLPATTVGQGRIGLAVSSEAPTLDLIADNGDDGNQTGSPSAIAYGAAPAAAATMTLSYGLGDRTDLEVAGEGALYYYFLPLPTGGSIGLRHHFDTGGSVDVGGAIKLGYVSSDAEVNNETSSARATYLALQGVIQRRGGLVRPLVALNIMPAQISRDPSDAPAFDFKGMASSITVGAMFVGESVTAGPYVALTNFYSDRYDSSGFFFSGGILFAIRRDRRRIDPPAPTYYAPPPGATPGAPPPPTPTVAPM